MADDYLNRALSRAGVSCELTGGGLAAAGLAPVLAACGGGDEGGDTAAGRPHRRRARGAAAGGTPRAGAADGRRRDARCGGGASRRRSGSRSGSTRRSPAVHRSRAASPSTRCSWTPSAVIPQFTDSGRGRRAAGRPVRVQRHLPHGERLARLHPGAERSRSPTPSSRSRARRCSPIYQGEQYRVGWYIVGFGIEYDKAAFEAAGLDPDSPPTTWDAFLDACDKIKGTGLIPLSAGVKDGFFGEWYFVNTLTQSARQPGRGDRPLHRRARLARPAVPRAVVEAPGARTRTASSTRTRTRSSSTRASSSWRRARRR